MINFDEEVQKFHPSLEIDEVEDTIYNESNLADVTDVMLEMLKKQKRQ